MTAAAGPVRRTSRDAQSVGRRLAHWLTGVVGAAVSVDEIGGTDANGMSSETLLFRARWRGSDGEHDERLVARIAPDAGDLPVFPSYDMAAQFDTLRLVAQLTQVPVPPVRWCEPTGGAIGTPFFVMDRVDGVVPPDVMPYTFGGNWLADATPEQQQRLQDTTVDALVALHAVDDAPARFAFLRRAEPGDTALRRHVAHTAAIAAYAGQAGPLPPLIDRGFAWLDAHWPAYESPAALSWGDARIGNVLYRDFAPVALLDWEMAGLGPRELDVAWLATSHRIFQHLTEMLGLPGMPAFLRLDDVAERYARASGHEPRDLDFFTAYAALQWAVVLIRTGQRQVHFGERAAPADPTEFVFHAALLEQLLTD